MRIPWTILSLSSVLVLAGCSARPVLTSSSAPSGTPSSAVQGHTITGRVHGGQNPVSGASVYLFGANTNGYGNASISELMSGTKDGSGNYYVTTNSSGDFTISGDWSCASTTQLYIYAIGGNPGSGTNSVAALLAGLGSCGALSSSQTIVVNEVSTIATAYSIAGFATSPTAVSSSGSTLAVPDIGNAFATIQNLETLQTGVALAATPNGGAGTVPQATLNTLANILAACINSNGAVTGPTNPTPCYTLFYNAESGTTPAPNTAQAALNIAHNPGANVANLFALQGSSPPFVPDLPSSPVPNDFTLGIAFTGGTWSLGPTALAVDGSGDIWMASIGNASFPEGGVGELLANGTWSSFTPVTGGGIEYDDPALVAVVPSTVNGANSAGAIWVVVNDETGCPTCIIALNPSTGAVLTGSTGIGDGSSVELTGGLAIASTGVAWITTEGDYEGDNYLYGWNSSTWVFGAGGGLTEGRGLAIDASGNFWVVNIPTSGTAYNLVELNSSGTAVTGSPFSGSGMREYSGGSPVAVDGPGNVWLGGFGDIVEFNSSGVQQGPSGGYSTGGIDLASQIAIDGASNIFTAPGVNNNSVTELSDSGTAISGSNGYTAGGIMNGPNGVAVDGSGNVWVTSATSSNLVEIVGLATPVVTPIADNLVSPYGSHAVNEP